MTVLAEPAVCARHPGHRAARQVRQRPLTTAHAASALHDRDGSRTSALPARWPGSLHGALAIPARTRTAALTDAWGCRRQRRAAGPVERLAWRRPSKRPEIRQAQDAVALQRAWDRQNALARGRRGPALAGGPGRNGPGRPSLPLHDLRDAGAEVPGLHVVAAAGDAVGARGHCAHDLIGRLVGARERDRMAPWIERSDAERGCVGAGLACVAARPLRHAPEDGLDLHDQHRVRIRRVRLHGRSWRDRRRCRR
jgi:hypothetical protein